MAPYRRRQRSPEQERALQHVRSQHGRVETSQEALADDRARRATAIRAALDAGVSLREVAEAIYVTPEAVRKMAATADA